MVYGKPVRLAEIMKTSILSNAVKLNNNSSIFLILSRSSLEMNTSPKNVGPPPENAMTISFKMVVWREPFGLG